MSTITKPYLESKQLVGRETEQSLPCKREESLAQFSERFWEVRRRKWLKEISDRQSQKNID
ncbi:MAG: hypothetical protein LBK82_05935 [Planctomycetaceae bacterium]|nr:hypothetical protein [Planctomycetaceae bacterium]